jgi:glycosyltransferase involved in cell wall biosynthesis
MASPPGSGTGPPLLSTPIAQDRLRLQFVVPFGPRFDSNHGGRVIAQLIDALGPRHEIAIVYQRADGEPPMDEELACRCRIVRSVPLKTHDRSAIAHQQRVLRAMLGGNPTAVSVGHSAALIDAVRETAEGFRPDVVQIEHDLLAYCIAGLHHSSAARVLVCHDPGLKAAEDLVAVTSGRRRLVHRLDALAWRRYWRRMLVHVDAVVTFTAQDARVLSAEVADLAVETIPLAIAIPAEPDDPRGTEPPTVVFVGGYIHPPNADAALRLLRSILPAVRRQHPGLKLTLVGERPTRAMLHAAGPHDDITGEVKSVVPFVNQAALLALPIRLGGGMRVKLLEALAAGKAVVASPLAAAGLDVSDGEQLRIAETDEEFALAIAELLDDPEARTQMAVRARAWAEQHLSWTQRTNRYEALYQRVISGLQLTARPHGNSR